MTNIPEFYVYMPTRKEVEELLKRMVAHGVSKYDWLECKKEQGGWDDYYDNDLCVRWGFHGHYGTYADSGIYVGQSDRRWERQAKQLTMKEVRVLLPLPSDNKANQQ